MELLYIAWKLE